MRRLIALLALAACSMHAAPKDTARIAIGTEALTLDPVTSQNVNEMYFEEAIFDGLLKRDPAGTLLPDLATEVPSRENGGISPDVRTFTYHLRHGVKWQDGSPFTSKDVAFTYRLLIDPKVASLYFSTYSKIAKLETPDAYTVRITMKKPSITALQSNFVGFAGYIVPEHLLAHESNLRHSGFGTHPVGTGPYRFVKWEHGNRIELAANPDYFGGPPHVAKVTVLFVGPYTTRAELLRNGDVDSAYMGPGDVRLLSGVSSVSVRNIQAPYLFFLNFNQRKAVLKDLAVRRAIAYATDRDLALRGLRGLETGEAGDTFVPPHSWGYDANNGCPKHDLRTANDVLTKAGWIRGSDGIRTRNGERLRFELSYVNHPQMESLALQLRQQWRAAGIETTLHSYDLNLFFDDNGILAKGRYDAGIDETQLNGPEDLTELTTGNNYMKYSNPNVDRWVAEADATSDTAARRALYAKVQRTACAELPGVPLYWQGRIYGVNQRLRNFQPNMFNSDLWNAKDWMLH